MNLVQRSILPFMRHVRVPAPTEDCRCPEDSWAPCGGQYEGRYAPECPEHRHWEVPAHWPSGCPSPERQETC